MLLPDGVVLFGAGVLLFGVALFGGESLFPGGVVLLPGGIWPVGTSWRLAQFASPGMSSLSRVATS